MKDEKVISVCKQIISAMEKKGYTLKLMFSAFDTDRDAMLTVNEFTEGMSLILDISPAILSKLFGFMDVLEIGMVNFEQFRAVMEAKAPF